MQQTAGESTTQRLLSRALPRDLVDEAYALVPRRGDITSWLEQQEATITYLSMWLGDGQPVTFYAPPSSGCSRRFNGTLGECTGLPWVVDCFYIRGLDRDFRENRAIRRALDAFNARTRYLDANPEIADDLDDARTPPPRAPSP
jgi:hypothetical protein